MTYLAWNILFEHDRKDLPQFMIWRANIISDLKWVLSTFEEFESLFWMYYLTIHLLVNLHCEFYIHEKFSLKGNIPILFFFFRYNAIIRPLKPRMGRPMTILMAVLIWVVAMAIAVPQLLYFTTEYNVQMDSITCIAYWPEGHEFM